MNHKAVALAGIAAIGIMAAVSLKPKPGEDSRSVKLQELKNSMAAVLQSKALELPPGFATAPTDADLKEAKIRLEKATELVENEVLPKLKRFPKELAEAKALIATNQKLLEQVSSEASKPRPR